MVRCQQIRKCPCFKTSREFPKPGASWEEKHCGYMPNINLSCAAAGCDCRPPAEGSQMHGGWSRGSFWNQSQKRNSRNCLENGCRKSWTEPMKSCKGRCDCSAKNHANLTCKRLENYSIGRGTTVSFTMEGTSSPCGRWGDSVGRRPWRARTGSAGRIIMPRDFGDVSR